MKAAIATSTAETTADRKNPRLIAFIPVRSLSRGRDAVELDTAAGAFRARAVVGADGVGSFVRRASGLGAGRLRAQAVEVDTEPAGGDPARDAARLAELQPQEQRYWRLVTERKGVVDERMLEFRWLLEELRVSFFAQELRTPQPVSVKRLDKAWLQLYS